MINGDQKYKSKASGVQYAVVELEDEHDGLWVRLESLDDGDSIWVHSDDLKEDFVLVVA